MSAGPVEGSGLALLRYRPWILKTGRSLTAEKSEVIKIAYFDYRTQTVIDVCLDCFAVMVYSFNRIFRVLCPTGYQPGE